MAMGDPSAYDRQKKIDQMRMGRGKASAGPLRQVTQDSKGNTTVRQRPAEMAMPTVLPRPISIERSPEYYADRDRANEFVSSLDNRDRAMAIPTAADAARAEKVMRDRNMVVPTERKPMENGPRQYANFAEFMKTMGLGK